MGRGSGDRQRFMERSVCPHHTAHNVSLGSNVQLHLPACDKWQRLAEARPARRGNGQHSCALGHSPLHYTDHSTAAKGCLSNWAVKAKINNSAWKANLKHCLINYL